MLVIFLNKPTRLKKKHSLVIYKIYDEARKKMYTDILNDLSCLNF